MRFSICFVAILELAEEDASVALKRLTQQLEEKRKLEEGSNDPKGGVLASLNAMERAIDKSGQLKKSFDKVWANCRAWATRTLDDAISFARNNEARDPDVIERALRPERWKSQQAGGIKANFAQQAWPSLKNRGWTAAVLSTGDQRGMTKYEYEGDQVRTVPVVWS